MLADTPILRNENKILKYSVVHYITFTRETIRKIVKKYSKRKLNDSGY